MFAIVEVSGHQYKVESGQELYVNRLQGEEGDSFSIDKVLLVGGSGATQIGSPTVSGAVVKASIVEHCKGDKVIVFHKKRRKGYRKKNGHRDALTKIKIDAIA